MEASNPYVSIQAAANQASAALKKLGNTAAAFSQKLQEAADKAAQEIATETLRALANGSHVIAFCRFCNAETLFSVGETKEEEKYRLVCNYCYKGFLEGELRVLALLHQTGKIAARRVRNLERREWQIEYENGYLPIPKEERNRCWLRERRNLGRERKGSFFSGRVRARSNLRRR